MTFLDRHVVLAALLLGGLVFLRSAPTHAEVKWEGDWPEEEVTTLSLSDVSQKVAVQELAEASNWDYVASDLGTGLVEIHVTGRPTKLVLEQLLSGGDYSVEREGSFVSIAAAPRDEGQRPPASLGSGGTDGKHAADDTGSDWDDTPTRPRKGEDLVVTEHAVIGPDDVVRDVFVWGGDVVVSGTVTRGVGVFGGSATFLEGSHVSGDVFGFASTVEIQNGAEVEGEVAVLGGALQQGDRVEINCSTCGDDAPKKGFSSYLEKVAGTLAEVSLLWVIGAILLAAGLGRARVVREELARRPLRNLGVGALGLVGLVVLLLTLVITLIGIPLAILVGIVSTFLAYLGVCLVMYSAGSLLLRGEHRNPYLQLAVGCGAYFLLRIIPGFGALGGLLVALLGIGALITTRLAGFLDRRSAPSATPDPLNR